MTPYIGGAAARVEAQLAFYRHVMIYVVANLLLAVLNFVQNPHHLWFHWVIFGWGIGLLAHGLNVYSYRWFGSRREQMIQGELERQQRLRESPRRKQDRHRQRRRVAGRNAARADRAELRRRSRQ